MNRNAAWFEQVTGCKPIATPKNGGGSHNHRSEVRIPFNSRTLASPVTANGFGPTLSVQIREITSEGIGLIHAADATLSATFAVLLHTRKRGGRNFIASCQTVHSKDVNRSLTMIGARIVSVVPEADPSPFAGPAAHAPSHPAVSRPLSEIERIRLAILG